MLNYHQLEERERKRQMRKRNRTFIGRIKSMFESIDNAIDKLSFKSIIIALVTVFALNVFIISMQYPRIDQHDNGRKLQSEAKFDLAEDHTGKSVRITIDGRRSPQKFNPRTTHHLNAASHLFKKLFGQKFDHEELYYFQNMDRFRFQISGETYLVDPLKLPELYKNQIGGNTTNPEDIGQKLDTNPRPLFVKHFSVPHVIRLPAWGFGRKFNQPMPQVTRGKHDKGWQVPVTTSSGQYKWMTVAKMNKNVDIPGQFTIINEHLVRTSYEEEPPKLIDSTE